MGFIIFSPARKGVFAANFGVWLAWINRRTMELCQRTGYDHPYAGAIGQTARNINHAVKNRFIGDNWLG